MKKIFLLLCIVFMFFITSCDNFGSSDNIEVPEGAIRLNKSNFEEYFKVRVTSNTSWWDHGVLANAYVSVSPKDPYYEVVGTVELKVNTYVYINDSSIPFCKIVSDNAKFYLTNDVVNECYTLTCQGDNYKINESSNTFELVSVSGYIVIGEQEPSELEKITEDQIANSNSVKEEINSLIDEWKIVCNNAKNYQFDKKNSYYFTSYYGDEDSSKSGGYENYMAKVDQENKVYSQGTDIYYASDDKTIYQEKIFNGMIKTNINTGNIDYLLSDATFNFDGLIDSSCVFIKENDNTYYGYTNFKDMEKSYIRDYILQRFNSYRIKSNYDDMVVKYTYLIMDDSLEITVELKFKDYHFHINFYELNYVYSQKISKINEISVTPYSSLENDFVLSDELNGALITKAGLVKIDCSTTEINFKTYNDDDYYMGATNPNYDNYLPVEITEAGVYNFENIKYGIYDSNGDWYSEPYFEKGIYFLRVENVQYGIKNRTINVSASRFKDYGDLNNPIEIIDNKFSCYLEGYGDMQVYSFIPDKDGIYELTKQNYVEMKIYKEDNLEEYISILRYQNFACYFEANTKYIFIIEIYNYEGDVNYEGLISYIGMPSTNPTATLEWNEYLLYDKFIFDVNILKTGEYQVEVEVLGGDCSGWKTFYKEDGSEIEDYDYNYDENDVCTYTLAKGKYELKLAKYSNDYLHCRIRLVLITEGVEEENNANLFYDKYTALTTTILTTTYSTSKFYFNVEKDSYILFTVDSNSFKIYDLDGNQVKIDEWQYTSTDKEFDNIKVKKSGLLKSGMYYIVFEKSRYSNTPTSYSTTLRLIEA
ncbi:MAG: hypothetical protein E7183_07230 [Erysipelotrichaceae bacterium]|nr:hypothetical protein [Erysipelotrichaceae bacterium]